MTAQFAEFKELKDIDKTTLISVLEESFRSVLSKMFGNDDNFDVIVNPDKGDCEIYQNLEVVNDGEVENPNTQISLSDAQADDDPDCEVGEEHTRRIDFAKFGRRAILTLRQTLASKIEAVELVYKGLVMGLRDYFRKNGLQRAVLGLSGGIDSALVAVLAVDALGAENVHGILMPSQYSTDHSVKDAEDLAHNLGMKYDIVPIRPMFDQFREALKPVFGDRAEDVTEENLQARVRGTLLMAYANKFGALVLNTTNRSEAAMGYGTLYGDSCGALSVIGDLYKTEVYQLSEWINRDQVRIPVNSITKAPSAELRPGQKDSDSLPDYSVLDAILNLYLDESLCEDEIVEEGYDRELVQSTLRKVARNEWKRLQFAPQIKVSPVSFTLDRRWPIS